MANWITHTILARELGIDEKGFVVGNVAPDCNQENEDWSSFTPPRDVTHWMRGRRKLSADYQSFFDAHITGRQFSLGTCKAESPCHDNGFTVMTGG